MSILKDGYFSVLVLHRGDLEREGYDASGIDDAEMETMSNVIGESLLHLAFWISLRTVAEEMKIPKLEDKND